MNKNRYTAQDYISAARTRFNDWNYLKTNDNCIIFAIYCAGVSIECILRAYIVKHTAEFDSKHDLEKLYLKSLISKNIKQKEKEKILSFIKIANKIWSNDLRYYSEKRWKRILAQQYVTKGSKYKNINKFVKMQYKEIFTAAEYIY